MDGTAGVPDVLVRRFAASSSDGLTLLASSEAGSMCGAWPAAFEFWRQFARRYFAALCRQSAQSSKRWDSPTPPDDAAFEAMLETAPPMRGLEYVSAAILRTLWLELDAFTKRQVASHEAGVAGYLRSLDPAWNLVGRVTFHLAENKKNPHSPFAFLATYTEGQTKAGAPQHVPLSEAFKQSIGNKDRQRLDELLEPVVRASKSCELVARMLESRRLFAPQAWGIRTPSSSSLLFRRWKQPG